MVLRDPYLAYWEEVSLAEGLPLKKERLEALLVKGLAGF